MSPTKSQRTSLRIIDIVDICFFTFYCRQNSFENALIHQRERIQTIETTHLFQRMSPIEWKCVSNAVEWICLSLWEI